MGKFVTNVYDFRRSDAIDKFRASGSDGNFAQHRLWCRQHKVGPPMPSENMSVEDLAEIGMIGLYERDDPSLGCLLSDGFATIRRSGEQFGTVRPTREDGQ